jgi:uncharacterized RDD family membrane protein YckC
MSDPTTNPYEAPKTELTDNPSIDAALLLNDASQGARFLNFIIDQIFSRFVLVSVLSFALGVLLALTGSADSAKALGFVFSLLVMFLYHLVLEAATGRTLGKLITGTRVVDEDGGKPTLGQIAIRSLVRFVPFEPFSFFGASPTGWHDRWSKTRVIKVRK